MLAMKNHGRPIIQAKTIQKVWEGGSLLRPLFSICPAAWGQMLRLGVMPTLGRDAHAFWAPLHKEMLFRQLCCCSPLPCKERAKT